MGGTVRIWGVRSSIPAPITAAAYKDRLQQALKIGLQSWRENPLASADSVFKELPPALTELRGGETLCVEVQAGELRLICDLGTGARPLGYDLMVRKVHGDLHLFLSSLEWAYIQGWPFFIPGYLASNTAHFYSAGADLEAGMVRQQNLEHFPVEFRDPMHSKKVFEPCLSGQSFTLANARLTLHALPNGSQCLRLEHAAESLGYLANPTGLSLADCTAHFRKVHTLLLGFPTRPEEAGEFVQAAVSWARSCQVKQLVFMHYHPAQDESLLAELEATARSRAGEMVVAFSAEGSEFHF